MFSEREQAILNEAHLCGRIYSRGGEKELPAQHLEKVEEKCLLAANSVDNERNKLYKDAIRKWGVELQIDMLIEEMSELMKALIKLKRKGPTDEAYNLVAEEAADVKIMLEQLDVMMWAVRCTDFPERVEKYKTEKLKRLVERIKMCV